MSLNVGQSVRAEKLKLDLTVTKKLGEGGQGAVYLVEGEQGRFAAKWYSVEQATPEQEVSIRKLTSDDKLRSDDKIERPQGPAGARFSWPMDVLVSRHSRQFGYLMRLIDTSRVLADGPSSWAESQPCFPAVEQAAACRPTSRI
jgi:hypothetical protein